MSQILFDPATITVGLTVLGIIGTLWAAGNAKFGGEA